MEYEYCVREANRPYGTPQRWGIFKFGTQDPPIRWSEDKWEMESVCAQMNEPEDLGEDGSV